MIFEKMREIIVARVEADPDQITMDTCLSNDLGVDSLDMLDILMDLEDAYDVDLPDKKLGTVVGAYVRYIEDQTGVEAKPDEHHNPESRKSA